MTVEPHAAYTVCIRPVLPPKPQAKLRVPLSEAFYAKMMADDAVQVRARFRKANGTLTAQASGEDANARRKQVALARRDELMAKALELLSAGELTSGQLRDICHASENQMRNALGYMRAEGLADFKRVGGLVKWHRVQVAAE